MSFEHFEALLNQLPFLNFLVLQGLGEIFCHPRILDFCHEVSKRKIYYGFSTNAVLLDPPTSRELLSIGVDWINFSIDTHDPAKYRAIRGVDVFDRVVENVRAFMLLVPRVKHKPRVEIRAVYMDNNIDDLPEILLLAARLGIRNVTLKEATSRAVVPDAEQRAGFYKRERTRIAEIVRKVRGRAKKQGINLAWQRFSRFNPRSCYLPWASCYITYDGYVTPCCNLENPDNFNLGNVFETQFPEIWNSRAYVEFRQHFLDLKKNRACIHHKECWDGFLAVFGPS